MPQKSTRLYYLTRDGKKVVTKHPDDRVKASVRASSVAEAWKVFKTRFISNPDGSLGKRLPGGQGDTRRVTIHPAGQAAPIGTPLPTSAGGVVIPERFQKIVQDEAAHEEAGVLAEEITETMQAQSTATALADSSWVEFSVHGVAFRLIKGSRVIFTSEEMILVPPPKQPVTASPDNAVDAMLAHEA